MVGKVNELQSVLLHVYEASHLTVGDVTMPRIFLCKLKKDSVVRGLWCRDNVCSLGKLILI